MPVYYLYIYYLHALYLLSMRYLHKTYIPSKYYLEAIYRIYILSICYLYSILYFYYLSYICTFLCFFLHIIYLYIHFSVYTYTYLVFYTILCQYSPHTPDHTHPQGAGQREGERIPTICTHLYTYCICNYVYMNIYSLLTYLPHTTKRGDHRYVCSYMEIITYPYRPHGSVDLQYSPMGEGIPCTQPATGGGSSLSLC